MPHRKTHYQRSELEKTDQSGHCIVEWLKEDKTPYAVTSTLFTTPLLFLKEPVIFPEGGGGVLGSNFAGYVPLASQNSNPIIVYSVASCRTPS